MVKRVIPLGTFGEFLKQFFIASNQTLRGKTENAFLAVRNTSRQVHGEDGGGIVFVYFRPLPPPVACARFCRRKNTKNNKTDDTYNTSNARVLGTQKPTRGLLRRLPVGAEAASRVRVRIAGPDDHVGRRLAFLLVRRHPVGDGRRGPPQEVLRPFGLPLLDRNAFRRGHPFGVVLAKIKSGNTNIIILAGIFNGLKKKIVKKKRNISLTTETPDKFFTVDAPKSP